MIVEILSSLADYRLTEVKEYWKDNGNGNPSYAFNRDALSTWMSRIRSSLSSQFSLSDSDPDLMDLADAEHTKLGELCPYVLTMLEQDSQYRPTASQVLGRLEDLDILLPNEEPLYGSCCTGCVFSNAGKLNLRLYPFVDNSTIGHTFPLWTEDYTFIVLSENGEPVHFANEWRAPDGEPEQRAFLSSIFQSRVNLKSDLHWLRNTNEYDHAIFAGDRSRCVLDPDVTLDITTLAGLRAAVIASLKTFQLKHITFTSRACNVRLPSQLATDASFHQRIVQVTRIPIFLPKSEYHGLHFIMLSFAISKEHDLPFEQPSIIDWRATE